MSGTYKSLVPFALTLGALAPLASQAYTYPVHTVTAVGECRTQAYDSENDACIHELPRITDIDAQRDDPLYRGVYTVLYGSTYTDWRDQQGSHAGIDIATSQGTPAYAITDAEVVFAGWQGGYGNVVKIAFDHDGQTLAATYGHLDEILVQKGDIVSEWEMIGRIGKSGFVMGKNGNHLHFQINVTYDNGYPIYEYLHCPIMNTNIVAGTNQGACRDMLFAHTVDPIALLEGKQASIGTQVVESWVLLPQALVTEDVVEEASVPTAVGSDQYQMIDLSEYKHYSHSLALQSMLLDYDMQLHIPTQTLHDGDDMTLAFSLIAKDTQDPLVGILPLPITVMADNPYLRLDAMTYQFATDGMIDVHVSAQQLGSTNLVIMVSHQVVGYITIDIVE